MTYLEWKENYRLERIKRNELWEDIPDYKGLYRVSNYGNVKSLSRIVNHAKSGKLTIKEKLLKLSIDAYGYKHVMLSKNGVVNIKKVHKLVSMCFLNHIPCGYKLVINHIDFDRQNNYFKNLEIVTPRVNGNQKHIKSSSKYTGVSWNKKYKKWVSHIRIKGKSKHLGSFLNEYDAHLAYENALSELLIQNQV